VIEDVVEIPSVAVGCLWRHEALHGHEQEPSQRFPPLSLVFPRSGVAERQGVGQRAVVQVGEIVQVGQGFPDLFLKGRAIVLHRRPPREVIATIRGLRRM